MKITGNWWGNTLEVHCTDREDGYVIMPGDQEEDRVMEAHGRDDKEEKKISDIKGRKQRSRIDLQI